MADWGAFATGLSQGVKDYATISDVEGKQEERAQKKVLFDQSVADYAYKTAPVGTMKSIIQAIPDLSDNSRTQLLDYGTKVLGYPTDVPIQRQHFAELMKHYQDNHDLQNITYLGRKEYYTDAVDAAKKTLANAPDDETKASAQTTLDTLTTKLGANEYVGEQLKKKQVMAEEKKAAAAETTAAKREPKSSVEMMAAPQGTYTEAQINEVKAHELALKVAGRDVTAAGLAARLAEKEARDAEKQTKKDKDAAYKAAAKRIEDLTAKGEKITPELKQQIDQDLTNAGLAPTEWYDQQKHLNIPGTDIKIPGTTYGTDQGIVMPKMDRTEPTAGGKQLTAEIATRYKQKYGTRAAAEAAARKDGYTF
jgi:hypothetical protein